MKKPIALLTSLIAITLLAACQSQSISQDAALAQANKIMAKHDETSFAYPSAKFTVGFTMTGEEGAMSREYRCIKDTYLCASLTTKVYATSSSAASEQSITGYLYSKDGKFIEAMDKGTSKSYTELTAADFATAMTTATASATSMSNSLGESCYSGLADFIKKFTPSSSSGVSSSNDSVKENYTFASKGDGNLTINEKVSMDSEGTKITTEGVVAFDNYYPVKISSHTSGNVVSSSVTVKTTLSVDATMNWTSCDTLYPDLSGYTKQ